MFDRIVLAPPRSQHHYHNTRTEVVEKRAPTDESVALLREMEGAAEAKRIASFKMDGNHFSGLLHAYENMADWSRTIKATFDINERRCTVELTVPADEKPEDYLPKLHQKVAEKIASDILVNMTRGFKL